MIVEERIYSIKVGKVPEQFKAYEELGMAAQKRILGGLIDKQENRILNPALFFEATLRKMRDVAKV